MSSSVNSPHQNETTNYREHFPLKQSNTLTAAALVGELEMAGWWTDAQIHKRNRA